MQAIADRRRFASLALPRESVDYRAAIALGIVVVCVVAEAALVNVGIDDLDEGYFLQQAARIVEHGQVPYRDFQTLYTPGMAYLNAVLFWMHGGMWLLGPRLLSLGARAGLALLLYGLAQPLVRNPLGAAWPAVALLVAFDAAPSRWEPHPGWLSTFFAVLAVWCLTHRSSTRWLLASGAAAAMAYVFKQNTGVFVLVAIVLRGLWCRRAVLLPLLAFAICTAVWLVPLAIALDGDLAQLGPLIGGVNQAGLYAPPELTIILPVLSLVGGLVLVRREAAWLLVAGVCLFLTQFPRMDTLHLAWSAPLLLVVGAVALDALPGRWTLAALALVATLAMPTMFSRIVSAQSATVDFDGVEIPPGTADDLHGVIADVQLRTLPGEPIFVYPTSPLVYVLADRPNAARFDHLNPGAASPAQIDEVRTDLQQANVKIVVFSDFWTQAWGEPGANAVLEDWLRTNFREVKHDGAYRVLARI